MTLLTPINFFFRFLAWWPGFLSLIRRHCCSGIGRRDVLDRFDIPVKIDLPGVGENLQVSFQRVTDPPHNLPSSPPFSASVEIP